MVVKRGMNDDGILAMAERFRGTGVILRFIEYMDVGATNGWRLDDVVPSREIVSAINERWALEPVDPAYVGEVAARYRYRDGGGEIGLISSVTQPFCRDCTRARLSAEGKLYTCLFASRGHDLRALVRSERLATPSWTRAPRRSGACATTATRSCARRARRSTCPRSRCRTSAASVVRQRERASSARATSSSMRTCSRRVPSRPVAAGASARCSSGTTLATCTSSSHRVAAGAERNEGDARAMS